MSLFRSLLVLIPFLVSAADGLSPSGGGGAAPGTTPGPGSAAGASGMGMWVMLPLVFGLMYFMVIRPQKKEEKRLKAIREGIKRGDKVVTIGGMHGEVVNVGEGTVDLRINTEGGETVVRFNKAAVATQVGDGKAA
jgi:preprotein translocase subunit YajC